MIFRCDHCGTTTDTGEALKNDVTAAMDYMDRITWYQWDNDVSRTEVVCGDCTSHYENVGQWRRFRGGAHLGPTTEQKARSAALSASHANLVGQQPEVQTVHRCEQCQTLDVEYNESPLYECGSCGQQFNRDNGADGGSHRCPECGKFGRKIADESCAYCDDGPLAQEPAVFCEVCNEWVLEGDWPAHIKDTVTTGKS